MERLRQLIREVHRRSLWQVLGIYLVASWAVLQVVDTLGGALRLPEWIEPMALVLLIIGLPIVLATAFVQEGGPGRDAGDVEVAAPAAPPAGAWSLFTWRNAFGGGVLAFALLGFVETGWILFGGGIGGVSEIEKSVAVMPCDGQSSTGDQGALAQGLAEGIINALAQLPDLRVIGINSVVALLEENADIETIARRLDVASVLECSLQQADDVIRIRPRLVEAATGAVLWSEEIDQPATNIFSIQDAVARAVTEEELSGPNPNMALFREFAALDVRLHPSRVPLGAETGSELGAETAEMDTIGAELAGTRAEDLYAELETELERDGLGEMPQPPSDERAVGPKTELGGSSDDGIVGHIETVAAPPLVSLSEPAPEGADSTDGDPSDVATVCHRCREDIPVRDSIHFCRFCGSDLRPSACRECGEAMEARWQFCASCGADVRG